MSRKTVPASKDCGPLCLRLVENIQAELVGPRARYDQATKTLDTARSSFLRSQRLLANIEDAALSREAHQARVDSASVIKHIQVAKAKYRLDLPPAPGGDDGQASQPGAGADGSSDAPSAQGSADHLLGVTPQALVQDHLLSHKKAQRAHASLLPVLEARILSSTSQLSRSMAATSTGQDDVHGPSTSGREAGDVPRVTAAGRKAQELQRTQQALADDTRQYAALAAHHLAAQQEALAMLAHFTDHEMLDTQQRSDQIYVDQAVNYSQALYKKVSMLELQFLANTYDAPNVAALRKVQEAIQLDTTTVHAALHQSAAQLSAYAALGPEFEAIAKQYGNAKELLSSIQSSLSTLQQVITQPESDSFW